MGTNYYLRKKCGMMQYPASLGCGDAHQNEPIRLTNGWLYNNTYYPTLESCKDFYQTIHIGKSSGGWYFSLAIYPEYGINNFTDWSMLLHDSNNIIINEYGEQISPKEMISTITAQKPLKCKQELSQEQIEEFQQRNHAILGSNQLWKPQEDQYHLYAASESLTFVYVISGNDPETGCIFC